MYQYQKTNRYFAQTAEGLEELFAEEAEKLGAEDIEKAFKGVFFTCGAETLYKINYFTRIATRIVAPLISFDCHSTRYLYNTVSKIDFSDFMNLDDTFAVFANVAGSIINHSQYAALCVKDAIVDQFRKKYGERPDVNPKTPDIWFHILINNNKAVLSLETSGGSLHRRGYRKNAVEAPMMENVAAAVIDLSGWDGEKPLVDPMCGSGTVLAEALIKHCNIPAGYLRKNFGFMYMPDFDSSVWENIKKSAEEDIKPLNKNLISGYDIDAAAVKFARQNLAALPNGQKVKIQNSDFRDLELQN
ncbi:MAG: class I SAM-dependent RNA methyltransferase, partial [Kosmotoga sp.]